MARFTLLLLLVAACVAAAWTGQRWARRRGVSPGHDGGVRAPQRPAALEDAWRAQVDQRADALHDALSRLMVEPPEDPAAAEELALLQALREADVETLTALAEGRGARSPAVIAGAQRVLARSHPDPQSRARWLSRFAHDFPRSWTLRSLAAAPR